ncbi:MAG: hypothetical protein ACXWCU_09415 [Caldimonas sp.]
MSARGVSRIIALAFVVTLCGCIAIPIPGKPDPGRRDNIDERVGERFQPGISTREDVLLTLGEPADVAEDASWVRYTNVRNLGHWFIGGCGGYVCNAFETGDTIRYRTVTVFFDPAGRVREVLNFESPADFVPEIRLLDERYKAVAEPGEGLIEMFRGAAWRTADRWAPGTIFVTDRALLFFEITDSGPLYRLALRLPVTAIASVDWAPEGKAEGSERFALVRRADGASDAFAFTPLSGDLAPQVAVFDRARTEHFIDVAGWLRPPGRSPVPSRP